MVVRVSQGHWMNLQSSDKSHSHRTLNILPAIDFIGYQLVSRSSDEIFGHQMNNFTKNLIWFVDKVSQGHWMNWFETTLTKSSKQSTTNTNGHCSRPTSSSSQDYQPVDPKGTASSVHPWSSQGPTRSWSSLCILQFCTLSWRSTGQSQLSSRLPSLELHLRASLLAR